ncbi:MAG: hypothetical protein IH940_06410 [Acidobacteria bacterium]|nr:hypothetical protein [Acidobacteriota bacterium]
MGLAAHPYLKPCELGHHERWNEQKSYKEAITAAEVVEQTGEQKRQGCHEHRERQGVKRPRS